jgi:hypothetical protein
MRQIAITLLLVSSAMPASAQPATAPAIDPDQPPGVFLDPGVPPSVNVVVPEQAPRTTIPADNDPTALTRYLSLLDPYGAWIEDPDFGTVWVPALELVGPDFVPYQTAGHWAYDGRDYVWMSDYPWGAVTFHYGRWVKSPLLGWAWIPGRMYAPAWVDWRVSAEGYQYIGWGPTPPDFIWLRGRPWALGYIPEAPYWYVASADIFGTNLPGRVLRGEELESVVRNARPFVPPKTWIGAVPAGHPNMRGPSPSSFPTAVNVVRTPPPTSRVQ